MTTSSGKARRKKARPDKASQTYFGRIEFYGGRHIIIVPEGVLDGQGLHSGDTVEVRVDNLAVTV